MSTAIRPILYTIGHSTRAVEELIEVLASAAVECVVDVRGIPRSRTNPQFNKDVLPGALADADIAREWDAPAAGHARRKAAASKRT